MGRIRAGAPRDQCQANDDDDDDEGLLAQSLQQITSRRTTHVTRPDCYSRDRPPTKSIDLPNYHRTEKIVADYYDVTLIAK